MHPVYEADVCYPHLGKLALCKVLVEEMAFGIARRVVQKGREEASYDLGVTGDLGNSPNLVFEDNRLTHAVVTNSRLAKGALVFLESSESFENVVFLTCILRCQLRYRVEHDLHFFER